MAKTKISEFSATPGNNTDIDGINIAEGCAPSGINDAIRELMSQLKDFQTGAAGDSFNGPIGSTTPAAGAFTTLTSNGATTLGDAVGDVITINGTVTYANANPTYSAGTANGIAYLNGSKVLTTGSAFSFDGTTQTLANASNTANTYNGINFTTAYTPTGTTNTNTDALVSFYGLDQNGVSGTYAGIKASHLTNSAVKSSSVGYLRLDTNQLSSGAVSANTNSYLQLVGGGASTLSSVGNLTLNAGVATGTGARIVFNADDGTEKMRLNGTGLGIGTTTPGYLLDVNGTANFASTVTFTGGTANGVGYLNGSKQFTTGSALTFDGSQLGVGTASGTSNGLKLNAGNSGANYVLYRDGTTGLLQIYGNQSGFNGLLVSGVDGQQYLSDPAKHVWSVSNSEQMRLTSTGLGIGTSSPSAKLDVSVGSGTTYAIRATSADASTNARFTARPYNGTTGIYDFRKQSDDTLLSYLWVTNGATPNLDIMNVQAYAITFGTNNTERARIDSSGKLGIGTTSPARKLHVAGIDPFEGIRVSGPSGDNNWAGGIEFYSNNASTVTSSILVSSGGMLFNYGGTERARIDSSGNLLVGTTGTPSGFFGAKQIVYSGSDNGINVMTEGNYGQVGVGIWAKNDTANTSYLVSFYNGTTRAGVGSITATGSTTSYATSSDYRLKDNIQPMTGALAFVRKQRPVTYNWKADGSEGAGYIAHWMQEDGAGNCVTGEKDAVDADGKPKYQGIDTSFMVAPLNAAVNELAEIVEAQAALIEQLIARVAKLEGK